MPPKARITKEDILTTTLRLVREQGEAGLSARSITKEVGCSTQPIYVHFGSMDELKKEVIALARERYEEFLQKETAKGKRSLYNAHGVAYIRFAKEEKELFKLLYMGDQTENDLLHEQEELAKYAEMIHEETGIPKKEAVFCHLEVWACIHGIATMLATSRLTWDGKVITRMLSDVYEGILSQYEESEE